MISAKIIADSVNPNGQRLTTYECTFNRWLLAELNTHRMLSRNSASSRAIPVKRVLSQVLRDPAYPVAWGANQAGMQAHSELTGWRLWLAKRLFFLSRYPALAFVWLLSKVGLHKQVANRILEPWVWHTAIVSMTEDENFFLLRDHPAAQPEFQVLAKEMKIAKYLSVPRKIPWSGWHLPYVPDVSMGGPVYGSTDPLLEQAKISAACCARVSYVRQNDRKSVEEDVKFTDRLSNSGHFSPLEHPAVAKPGQWGNFSGWMQLRKLYPNESGVTAKPCTCDTTPDVYESDCERHRHE